MPDLPDLSKQLRAYIDDVAEPVGIDEAQDPRGAPHPLEVTNASKQLSSRRFFAAAAAAVVILILGSAVLVSRRGSDDVATGPAQPPPAEQEFEFQVLAMGDAVLPIGTLASAVDDDELVDLWQSGGFAGSPSGVDFERWVVVSITIPDDACPPALTAFVREGSTWTPTFVEPAGACIQPLIAKTYVVAINRSMVTPEFVLRLPADPYFIDAEQLLRIEVPPVDAADDLVAWCGEVPAPGPIAATEPAMPDPDLVLVGVLYRYAGEHADTFGGLWIDPDRGGTIVLTFTDDPAPHRAAIAALVALPDDPAGYPKPPGYVTPSTAVAESGVVVEVFQVDHTDQEILALLSTVPATLASSGIDTAAIGASVQLNRVEIGLTEPSDEARRAIAKVLPADLLCVDRMPQMGLERSSDDGTD